MSLPPGSDDSRPNGWRKRHLSQRRAILPVDLKIRPAVAAIFGALLTMIIAPQAPRQAILDAMFTQILRAEIQEKPGRTYPRHRRRSPHGKGNTRAQYQRRKQRKAEKQNHPG